ncbi:hypothetical protein B4102_0233 [Heyndrickxia sporothermodurans]|uniref:Uncharacterized protein n=1 Tax=Heyndrickxia sporothermodurans TaxID=46224 RepID=A0A150KUC8_9BACI|nr:hypothetical protein [Heyndrickxia sporothermodurans]KYD02639.1 hypothetical protein B4102_0233 [Heyndrickxia sporothermodurans]
MTPIELVDALVEYVKQIVKDFNLTTKVEGVSKVPSVYAGYLPNQDEDEDEDDRLTPNDYPFIIIRYLSESDELYSENVVNIRLLIGTFSEEEQNGWRDTINIATRIKMELKKKMYLGPFVLKDKIQIELFEEQLKPFWHGIMDLTFNIPQIQPETEW